MSRRHNTEVFPDGRLSADPVRETSVRRALLLRGSHLRRWTRSSRRARKREGASRRAPTRSTTQIFLITTAAPFPRHSYCSSKNVRESPSKFSEKVLCTKKPYSVHLTGRCVFYNAKLTKRGILCLHTHWKREWSKNST